MIFDGYLNQLIADELQGCCGMWVVTNFNGQVSQIKNDLEELISEGWVRFDEEEEDSSCYRMPWIATLNGRQNPMFGPILLEIGCKLVAHTLNPNTQNHIFTYMFIPEELDLKVENELV